MHYTPARNWCECLLELRLNGVNPHSSFSIAPDTHRAGYNKTTMHLSTGCDLVHIPTFQAKVAASQGQLLTHVFHDHELAAKPGTESRAGLYAIKEAALKAFGLPPGSWHAVEITFAKSGAPQLAVAEHDCTHTSVSMSHHGDYALAVVVHLAP